MYTEIYNPLYATCNTAWDAHAEASIVSSPPQRRATECAVPESGAVQAATGLIGLFFQLVTCTLCLPPSYKEVYSLPFVAVCKVGFVEGVSYFCIVCPRCMKGKANNLLCVF